jgi:site-specific recombinase XerD
LPFGAWATIPAQEILLAGQKSHDKRRVSAQDIQHFLRVLCITSHEELLRVDRKAVIALERHMRGVPRLHPLTIRRSLSALSTLFTDLVRYGVVLKNPVQAVEHLAISRREGMALAYTPQQPGAFLDAPDPSRLKALRDLNPLVSVSAFHLYGRLWLRHQRDSTILQ